MINAGWDNGVSVGYTLNGESRMAIIAPKPNNQSVMKDGFKKYAS